MRYAYSQEINEASNSRSVDHKIESKKHENRQHRPKTKEEAKSHRNVCALPSYPCFSITPTPPRRFRRAMPDHPILLDIDNGDLEAVKRRVLPDATVLDERGDTTIGCR